MSDSDGRFVAVGGPIGVGKSVFADLLAAELNGTLLEETFEDNPFLEKLYQPGGKERWGLACEISFLPPRLDQADRIERLLDEGRTVITDWVMHQNLIFASITLGKEEFGAYRDLFHRLTDDIPAPDLLVHLDAEPEALMERIRARGREAEYGLEMDYLREVRQRFLDWRTDPPPSERTTFIQTTDLDIPHDERARMEAVGIVENALDMLKEPSSQEPAATQQDPKFGTPM